MESLKEILSPDFLLRNSLYTSMLIGFACPLVGVFLVLRRLVFITAFLAMHATIFRLVLSRIWDGEAAYREARALGYTSDRIVLMALRDFVWVIF